MLRSVASQGPWEQAIRLAFSLLFAVTLLAGVGWAVSHIRLVPTDSQAVVLRFGAIDRVQGAGLLFAWPSPIEEVVMVPSRERVLELHLEGLQREAPALADDSTGEPLGNMGDALAGSGYLLTGDIGVVHLAATVYYRVSDPTAYVLQADHVLPALDRLVSASALRLSAGRDLDTILATRPELPTSDAAVKRERLRAELVQESNRSLGRLAERGVRLGVEVVRIDLVSSLPRAAVSAFNAVLTASQKAEHAIANAHTDAVLTHQRATAEMESLLASAHAQASERIAQSQQDTKEIIALAQQVHQGSDPELLERLYRARIQPIIAKAGQLTTVDPKNEARLIVPGTKP